MRSFPCFVAPLVVAGGLLLAGPALAQSADQWFAQGVAAFERGQNEEALKAFQAAWKERKSYDVASALGQAEMALKMDRDAAEHLAYALKNFPVTAKAEKRAAVEKGFAEVRAKVGAVRVSVNVEGAKVKIGGEVKGTAPIGEELFVAPGSVTVEVEAEGYEPARKTVEVAKGGSEEVTLSLVKKAGAVVEERAKWPAYVLGGAALVGLGVGGGLLGAWADKRGEVKSTSESIRGAGHSCVTGAANFDARCVTLASDARTAETLNRAGIGALVGGGVLAAAAVGYLLFWPRPSAGQASTGQRVSVVPVVSSNGAAALVQGTF